MLVSGGKWTISVDGGDGDGEGGVVQKLRWWHGVGPQNLTVKGVRRRVGMALGREEEDPGYLDQCGQGKCVVM